MPDMAENGAREVIANIRKQNGGISASRRAFLQAEMPDVLEALMGVRRQLANATKMYVSGHSVPHDESSPPPAS